MTEVCRKGRGQSREVIHQGASGNICRKQKDPAISDKFVRNKIILGRTRMKKVPDGQQYVSKDFEVVGLRKIFQNRRRRTDIKKYYDFLYRR